MSRKRSTALRYGETHKDGCVDDAQAIYSPDLEHRIQNTTRTPIGRKLHRARGVPNGRYCGSMESVNFRTCVYPGLSITSENKSPKRWCGLQKGPKLNEGGPHGVKVERVGQEGYRSCSVPD